MRSLLSTEAGESLRNLVSSLHQRRSETFTRLKVHEWLGIGQATVSRLVGELVRNGFAIEIGKERSEGA